MRAAFYFRVSTDEQASSAEEQERGGLAWCKRNGHEVVATFRDVGVSGAEWKNRPGVLELERQAKLSPRPFDLVVVRDADRLGRDVYRLPMLISSLYEHGVKVVAWSTGETVAVDDATARLVLAVKAGVAEVQREHIAHATRTALKTRAERGLVVGGRVFGYDNERGPDGVRYVVNEAQAAVVREIFQRRAAGESGRNIARAFNARRVPSPHVGDRGSGSWCTSAVRFIACNPRYRGEATWGRAGSAYVGGSRVDLVRDDSQVITYAVEPIVDEDLWYAAQDNTAAARDPVGRHVHRGPRARHLLINHAVCGACKGPIGTARTSTGVGANKVNLVAYVCLHARDRGTCDNKWRRPVDRLDGPVLDWMLSAVLAPDVVGDAIERSRAAVTGAPAARVDPKVAELRAVVADLERRIANLQRALEDDDGDGTRTALRGRREELAAARRELAAVEAPAVAVAPDDAAALLARIADLRPVFEAARAERPDLLRAVLAAVLVRPIVVTPTGDVKVGRKVVLDLDAEAAPGALLNLRLNPDEQGVQGPQGVAGGSQHPLPPQMHENTYNRETRGMAVSPAGVEPALAT